MKILIINTSELTGGAAVAANRLMKALRKSGIDVTMLVRDKKTNEPNVVSVSTSFISNKMNFIRFVWERIIIFLCNHFHRNSLFQVSIANTGIDISSHPLVKEADIIHLHWINQGFLSLQNIKKLARLGKPVVWTMHDMWPCTGICHYSFGCNSFMKECGNCQFLDSNSHKDLSYRVFHHKSFLVNSNIHLVAVSSWLKGLAQESQLTKDLSISMIPNVIDTQIFFQSDKWIARKELSLPLDKKIILMGAARIDDPIKGFTYLHQALSKLKSKDTEKSNNILLVLFGDLKGNDSILHSLPVPFVSMGYMSDNSQIAKLYTATDITVVPSLYETFGQTLIEAMACGCPAVSFNNSGQTDIIDHLENGYLAKYKDIDDLSFGIQWTLDNCDRPELKQSCVSKVQSHYQEAVIAEKYITLYKQLHDSL